MAKAAKKTASLQAVQSACKSAVGFTEAIVPVKIHWGQHETPCGKMIVAVDERGALRHFGFMHGRKLAHVLDVWVSQWKRAAFVEDKAGTAKIIATVFAPGKARRRGVKIRVAGTAFQQAVWQALLDIPYGEVASYAEIARRIGKPRAMRAVGTACGANPVSLLIPCHRVVASDGTLGGYGGNVAIKDGLLRAEGTKLNARRKRMV